MHATLDTIAEALAENGKVLVTGFLAATKDEIIEYHPNVLGVIGPYVYDEVNGLSIVGCTYMDAPEVDGKVYLSDDFAAEPDDLL